MEDQRDLKKQHFEKFERENLCGDNLFPSSFGFFFTSRFFPFKFCLFQLEQLDEISFPYRENF